MLFSPKVEAVARRKEIGAQQPGCGLYYYIFGIEIIMMIVNRSGWTCCARVFRFLRLFFNCGEELNSIAVRKSREIFRTPRSSPFQITVKCIVKQKKEQKQKAEEEAVSKAKRKSWVKEAEFTNPESDLQLRVGVRKHKKGPFAKRPSYPISHIWAPENCFTILQSFLMTTVALKSGNKLLAAVSVPHIF